MSWFTIFAQWVVDIIFASIVIWFLHLVFSWPWILIGIISVFMAAVRVEDYRANTL